MKKDLFGDISTIKALSATAVSANGTTNGDTITVGDALGLCFIYQVHAFSAGTATPLIQDSPDGTAWTDVADDFLSGTEAGAALSAANTHKRIGYLGKQPYVRLASVGAGSASYTVSAVAVLSPLRLPVAQ